MCNTLELSGLFVCLGGGDLLSFSLHGGTKKIAGLWFAGGGISTQADTTTGSPYTVSKTKFVQLDTFHS